MPDFIETYFTQTRQEIDTEKHSRDNILNVIILVLGAVGFALFQAGNAQTLLRQPVALVIEITMLATITGLFWLRRKKLHQIADRWFVLHNLLRSRLAHIPVSETLEAIVEKDLKTTRYTRKDVWLCLAVACPIYGLVAASLHERFGQKHLVTLSLVAVVVAAHATIVTWLMIRPFKCPEPLATASTKNVPNQASVTARKLAEPQG
jgi:undecaprenyl pyrophosphate phosphatase UppP